MFANCVFDDVLHKILNLVIHMHEEPELSLGF